MTAPASQLTFFFESLNNFIERGNLIVFSEKQWQSIILQFAKKYLPAEYSSLCRFANDNGDLLFQNLVKFINSDSEIAKIRDQLSKVTSGIKEPIFLSVRSVQNYFSRILSLTFPTLEDENIKSRADFLTTRCIPHLVSTTMAKKLQQHLLYKSSLGEKVSIDNICSFIESNEVLNPELRIPHPLTLPSSCLYLEFDVSENQIERVESNFTRMNSRSTKREDNKYENRGRQRRSSSFNKNDEK